MKYRTSPPAARTSVLAAFLTGFAALSAPTFGSADSTEPTAPLAATTASVTVAYATRAEMVAQVSVSGTLVPRDEILVFPQVSGAPINMLLVDVGDTVAAGDVLAMLNDSTLTAQMAQSEAELARAAASVSQARSQILSAQANATQTATALERAQTLRDTGSGTQAALDQAIATDQSAQANAASANDGLLVAQAQVQQAQAQLDIAALNLDRATLRAPAAGLISARNGQIGAIASSGGEPIFRIIGGGIIEVEADVIETALGSISVGDVADLAIAGVGTATGTVRRISPTVDPRNRLGTIRIDLANTPGLRSGIFVSGRIVVQQRTSLAVPTPAVLTDTAGTYVLLVVDGHLQKRTVTAGLIWNGLREIVTGLVEGDVVVARAGAFFGDGDQITPIYPVAAPPDATPVEAPTATMPSITTPTGADATEQSAAQRVTE